MWRRCAVHGAGESRVGRIQRSLKTAYAATSSALIPSSNSIRARYPRFRALIGLAGVQGAHYAQLRFTMVREYSIGKRLVEATCQPYSWFLSRHSADLGKTIPVEVGTVISNGFTPMMTLIAQARLPLHLTLLIPSVPNPRSSSASP